LWCRNRINQEPDVVLAARACEIAARLEFVGERKRVHRRAALGERQHRTVEQGVSLAVEVLWPHERLHDGRDVIAL
jgi:hypothetical protein